MKTIIYDNDFISEYDETFVKGDLITAYNKGFYEFDHSESRGEDHTPVYYFRLKYDERGRPRNGKKLESCDASYCRRADGEIKKLIQEHELSINRLKSILGDKQKKHETI